MSGTAAGRVEQFCRKYDISVSFYEAQTALGLKWCYKCQQWKSVDDFSKDKSRWDGCKAKCGTCDRVKEKKDLKGRVSSFKGKKHTAANIKLFRSINSGSRNPNWKGGITKLISLIRNSREYKEWRMAVYRKGKFTCSDCGIKKRGRNIILDADHIKSIYEIISENNIHTIAEALNCKELFDINNGRCLCRPCHKKTPTWGINKHKIKKDVREK